MLEFLECIFLLLEDSLDIILNLQDLRLPKKAQNCQSNLTSSRTQLLRFMHLLTNEINTNQYSAVCLFKTLKVNKFT